MKDQPILPPAAALVFTHLMLFLCIVSAPAQNYTVIDLGWPPPSSKGVGSEAHGINKNGAVVGTWYLNSSKGSQYAFVYANGTNTDLGTISAGNGNSYDYAVASAINSSNQIVGQGTTNSYSFYHAFLNTNGVMIDLDNTGKGWSGANAINQRGQIVGFFTTPSSYIHAFLYTNNSMLDLGTLSGGAYSSARGINDSGIIVGESSDSSGNTYAFVVYSNYVMTGLGNLGGTYSSAAAVNNSGTIVGESWLPNGELRAFVISNGIMVNLGTLGGTNSSAQAINNGGLITGFSNDSNQLSHAFVYYGSTMLNLDTILPPHCAFTNLAYGYGINDAGQICGGGLNTNGVYDAFLLTPPVLSLTCSSNIIVTAPNSSGTAVSFTLSASGGCSQPTVTANPPSGSTFPIGTNTVNVTATDLCGHTNTCSFTVTVRPPPPPVNVAGSFILTNHFAMTILGSTGQVFVLQTSSNLVNWVPLRTNTLLGSSTNWMDPSGLTNNHRYYRTLTLPQ
jgi:probable HAF family extracellular repeat protein